MNYRPARWTPPASSKVPVACVKCGKEHFTVFYITETLGMQQCETCLRTDVESTAFLKP